MVNPFQTSRRIPATAAAVFAAIQNPQRLARWWGPAGFTNTFDVCELQPGGRWQYTMQGPDGRSYRNESEFEIIEPDRQIVIRHISEPKYRLTIELRVIPEGTEVHWTQAFDSDYMAEKLAPIIVPSNEENLDRLTKEVLHGA